VDRTTIHGKQPGPFVRIHSFSIPVLREWPGNGTTVITGTWVGDTNARTITSTFPAVNNTLQRLNDTWQIFNNTLTMVEANPTSPSRSAYLKLVKK
jgi:hypothetical protein